MGPYWGGGNGVIALIMMAVMFLFMAGVIVAILGAIRGFTHSAHPAIPGQTVEDRALAVLRERYARGEIDHAEYDDRHRRLANDAPR